MKKNKKAIALLADSNYLPHTRQVFYSAVCHGNWTHELLLLAYELDDHTDLSWFHKHHIQIIHIDRHTLPIEGLPPERMVYYGKLYLFHPRFSQYQQIIYLDTDMIIRKDLTGLLRYQGLAACHDVFRVPLIHQFTPLGTAREIAPAKQLIPKKWQKKISFNTGMMVIPTAHNTEQRMQQLMEKAARFAKYSQYYEQGVINLQFIQTRKPVPYVYNDYFSSEPFNRKGLFKRSGDHDAVILHIIHPHKPWDPQSPHYKEWHHRTMQSASAQTLTPGGEKPSQWSVIRVDIINYINIHMLYLKGIIRDKPRYLSAQAGKVLRKILKMEK